MAKRKPPATRKKKIETAAREQKLARRGVVIGAKYDAAQSTTENANLWKNADTLSPNLSATTAVREVLRKRARYEYENNSYANALVNSVAADTIGTGPRLQLAMRNTGTDAPETERETAREIEQRFADWADGIGLADKLRLLQIAMIRDGESFALRVQNTRRDPAAPQLDYLLIETEQVCGQYAGTYDPRYIDGVTLDEFGYPLSYDILDLHPGDGWAAYTAATTRYDAERVIHLFTRSRAGQARGIPALTPALALYGQLRRYGSAVLSAAELHATIAGVLTQQMGPGGSGDEPPTIEEMDAIPLARNALLTLGAGQDAKAFQPSQPVPSYKEFKGEILTEAGRSIGAPRNLSLGSSAEYNYSSGRLDHLPYQRTIRIAREKIRREILDRVFRDWYSEARLIPGYLSAAPEVGELRTRWRWPGFDSIDPLKDAKAAEARLTVGLSTYERECAELGEDWEEIFEQRAREKATLDKLGIAIVPVPAQVKQQADAEDMRDMEDTKDTEIQE